MFGACAATGLAWFVLLDVMGIAAPRLKYLWITHGVTGMAALLLTGAVLPQHVATAWLVRRNRVPGALALLALTLTAASALLLMYGPEAIRDAAHWVHVGAGAGAAVLLTWHVFSGRRLRSARLERLQGQAAD